MAILSLLYTVTAQVKLTVKNKTVMSLAFFITFNMLPFFVTGNLNYNGMLHLKKVAIATGTSKLLQADHFSPGVTSHLSKALPEVQDFNRGGFF